MRTTYDDSPAVARLSRPPHPRAFRRALRGVTVALILASLPGCFSLGRDPPALQQYVIGGAGMTESLPPMPGIEELAVGVRRLDLAPHLSSPAIVVRRGVHEILTSDFQRWAEDPAHGINRAFARHLSDAAPFQAVRVAPWPSRSRYEYLIQLHVTRFEGVVPDEDSATEGIAHIRATWEIIRAEDERVMARGNAEHREEDWTVGDYAGLVALLDEGLAVVAREVALALGALAGASAPG